MNLIRERLLNNAGLTSDTELQRLKTSTTAALEEWKVYFEATRLNPPWMSTFGARTRALFDHYTAGESPRQWQHSYFRSNAGVGRGC